MPLAAGFAFAVSLVLNAGAASIAQAQISVPPALPAAQTPQQYVESYFADAPIMEDIARCESHFKQYDVDGSVYRGEINTLDVGIMQINEHYHAATAKKLGLDLYTIQGNVAYARYLYEKQGTAPWSSSEVCWGSAKNHPAPLVATAQK